MDTPDDTTLMAYADGELDAAARAAIEARLAAEPALAERVRQHQSQRARLALAFGPVLDEPVPERLRLALEEAPAAAPGGAPVASLAAARGEREARQASQASQARTPRVASGWARWGGMAASLALGTLLGATLLGRDPSPGNARPDGRVLAGGELARALSDQPAGPATGPVQVALSFVDRGGRYCRAFVASDSAGLACRDGGDWTLQVVAPQLAASSAGLRQAATALPPVVLQAVDERLQGQTLDAAAERAALQGGWKP